MNFLIDWYVEVNYLGNESVETCLMLKTLKFHCFIIFV
jgi:hypothetical protein